MQQNKGPLHGIVVIDLTRILSGPFSTRILLDLGARVIKIEPPSGDPTRSFAARISSPSSSDVSSAYFAAVNAGKETITLNLRADDDRATLTSLLQRADVLVENYRPGVMRRLGFHWDAVHALNPRLVMCSISGFGQTGPDSHLGAVDTIIQATSGIMSVTSTVANGSPTRAGVSISDILAGVYASSGIQAALLARERQPPHHGAYVDISMLDCSVAASLVQLGQWHANGKDPLPIGNRNPVVAPFDNFTCKDNTKLVVVALNTEEFIKLCTLLGVELLLERPEFRPNSLRLEHADELSQELERVLVTKTAEEWMVLFRKNGVTCAPINSPSNVYASPQVQARSMALKSIDGRFVIAGNPVKISGYEDLTVRSNPPVLNERRDEILKFAKDGRSKL